MFTGLIEEIGVIRDLQKSGEAICFSIEANLVMADLAVDHSISINGVCLTATKISDKFFECMAVEETLRKTNLNALQRGHGVNLERAVRATDRLGGHLVQGHVDDVGTVSAIQPQSGGVLLSVRIPEKLGKYIISEGSVTINGVSLTVARLQHNELTIALIPHTLGKTNLGQLNVGDAVNIEVDVLAKYVEKLFQDSEKSAITENWLAQQGFSINE